METAQEKPLFRSAFKHRRSLTPIMHGSAVTANKRSTSIEPIST
jgi:hypothetical protein